MCTLQTHNCFHQQFENICSVLAGHVVFRHALGPTRGPYTSTKNSVLISRAMTTDLMRIMFRACTYPWRIFFHHPSGSRRVPYICVLVIAAQLSSWGPGTSKPALQKTVKSHHAKKPLMRIKYQSARDDQKPNKGSCGLLAA